MLLLAMALVFVSAVLHVSWNVKLQSQADPLDVSTKAVAFGLLLLTPVVAGYWLLHGAQLPAGRALWFAFLSGLAELGYFGFLSYSYTRGELSTVYPIARGSAPLLSFVFGVLLLHESVSGMQVAGVICLLAGVWLVRSANLHAAKGVVPALLTGVFIASYTVVDKMGLAYADPVTFGWLKYFFTALCLAAAVPFRSKNGHREEAEKAGNGSWATVAFVGVCIIATYQLVLFALKLAPVALVSPLRESASVVVTIWGIWKLKEREGVVRKLVGVASIFAGIVLLAI